jgi:hypothetical protein
MDRQLRRIVFRCRGTDRIYGGLVMPLNLDSCITGIFTPGNIGASSGLPPVAPTMPPLEPSITSDDTIDNVENSVLAHALTSDKVVVWSIVGGADAAKFELSGSTLRWLGNGTKDFEIPDDADLTGDYLVTVRATDVGGNMIEQTITVTVTDVTELPPGFAGSAMLPDVFVNSDGTKREANANGVMVNL